MWWFAALFIGAFVVSYMITPKPQARPPAGIDEFRIPTAQEGREIPVLFGTKDIVSPNIVWYGDLRVQAIRKRGGKK